jgi:hypothetical protein
VRRIATVPYPFLKGGFDSPQLRILSQFLNIDNATIKINLLLFKSFLGTMNVFALRILDFYKFFFNDCYIKNIFRLIIIKQLLQLSRTLLYFVGDPFGFVSNMGKGVKTAFYEPSKGNIEV